MRCSSPRVSTRTVPRDLARRTPPGAIPTHWSTMSPIRPDTRADGATARTARCCGSTRRVPRAPQPMERTVLVEAATIACTTRPTIGSATGVCVRSARGCSSVRRSRNQGASVLRRAKGRTSCMALPTTRTITFFRSSRPTRLARVAGGYCHKCQGLWMGLNANSACPATGEHSKQGSGEYLGHRKRLTPTARARKAGGGAQSVRGSTTGGLISAVTHKCPGGGDHKTSGSKYRVQYRRRIAEGCRGDTGSPVHHGPGEMKATLAASSIPRPRRNLFGAWLGVLCAAPPARPRFRDARWAWPSRNSRPH